MDHYLHCILIYDKTSLFPLLFLTYKHKNEFVILILYYVYQNMWFMEINIRHLKKSYEIAKSCQDENGCARIRFSNFWTEARICRLQASLVVWLTSLDIVHIRDSWLIASQMRTKQKVCKGKKRIEARHCIPLSPKYDINGSKAQWKVAW